tara:strand:- start:7308 stop:7529 length:222 start_codon:yes stop_codon:yes gene_type:complete
MTKKRDDISDKAISVIASQIANIKIKENELTVRAEVMENLTESIAALRNLPLKDVEPAIIFRPILSEKRAENE